MAPAQRGGVYGARSGFAGLGPANKKTQSKKSARSRFVVNSSPSEISTP